MNVKTKHIRYYPLSVILLTLGAASVLLSSESAAENAPDQKKSKQNTESSPFSLKVPVNLVVVNATVTDREGEAVADLKAEDFRVYEDGKPQKIQTFSSESSQTLSSGETVSKTTEPGDAPETVASEKRPRLISCVIDDITARSYDLMNPTIAALRRFIGEELKPGDQLGVASASGSFQIPFTSDRALLLRQLGDFALGNLNRLRAFQSDCPRLPDSAAEEIMEHRGDRALSIAREEYCNCTPGGCQDLSPQDIEIRVRSAATQQHEQTLFRSRRLLSMLQQSLRSLQHFEGRKSLVLFSEGFFPQRAVRYDVQEVTNRALRAGVALNVVDLRGLYTVGFESRTNADGTLPIELRSQSFSYIYNSMAQQLDLLQQMAQDTGGTSFHNSNDLYKGLKQVSDARSHNYVLSYASPDLKTNGSYHSIRLEVTRPGLKMSYRKGYFEPREQVSFENRRKEDIMEALQTPVNLGGLPVQLSYKYFQLDPGRYELSLLTKVNIRSVQFLNEDALRKNLFHVVVVVFDENNQYVEGRETAITLSLTDASFAAMQQFGFVSKLDSYYQNALQNQYNNFSRGPSTGLASLLRADAGSCNVRKKSAHPARRGQNFKYVWLDLNVRAGRYKIRVVVRESNEVKIGSAQQTISVPNRYQ